MAGNYVEAGRNHGRKFYQKIEKIEGHNGLKVLLYFWDARDGKDCLGWWFGLSSAATTPELAALPR